MNYNARNDEYTEVPKFVAKGGYLTCHFIFPGPPVMNYMGVAELSSSKVA